MISRNEEQEPVAAIPPVAGVAIERVQVAAIIVAVEAEQIQVAVRIGNMRNVSSLPPPLEYSWGCIGFGICNALTHYTK